MNEQGLTYKQARFVDEFIANKGSGAEAARRAYGKKYSAHEVTRLLRHPTIAQAIAQKTREIEDKAGLAHNQEAILAEISKLAADLLVCSSCGKQSENDKSIKLKALELLGKYHAMWTDKTKNETLIRYAELSKLKDDELEEVIAEVQKYL